MPKPKTRADLAHSLEADWPPHQPITLTDLVAGARAVDWDFTASCYASGYDASDPDARRMFDCLLAYSGTRASRACIDQPPAHLVQTAAPPGGSTSLRDNVRSLPCSSGVGGRSSTSPEDVEARFKLLAGLDPSALNAVATTAPVATSFLQAWASSSPVAGRPPYDKCPRRRSREPSPESELAPWERVLSE